ncbi:MAG: hypothetical protein SGJ18_08735 [Pseudomonadota bacterium]|nr:hypothetical protein [Pseudomonadota bacterium]
MKKILTTMSLFLASTAFASTSVNEKFIATFSDYNQFDQMVKCSPGHRGHYPTLDMIAIKSHAVDMGLSISDKFRAESSIGLKNDPKERINGPRPYDAGCKPAMEQLKAAITGKEVVEVTVNRTVTVSPNTDGRAYRKVNGEVLNVRYVTTEQSFESVKFELGGFVFTGGQLQNGKSELL